MPNLQEYPSKIISSSILKKKKSSTLNDYQDIIVIYTEIILQTIITTE